MSITMSEASATTLRMAVESAKAAAAATAHTAAMIMIEAGGGQGSIHCAWRGEGPDALCLITATSFSGHVIAGSHGDRVQITLPGLTPAAYEQMRTWSQDRNECHHEHDCDCLTDPWPTLATLSGDDEEHDIDYRDDPEYARGSARLAFGRVTVKLDDEPVTVADTLIRISRHHA
ncbi:hypothetical protein [Streptomyces sp. NBC_01244]|uniref:hypothetical protein n=1 Tax=Streptomyces sp. NBC_01244 TaxID=2903797 RepID=UPI002E0F5A7E|nr:hypothetical protein OG247_44090 [Streptomyces sp. NBC_01244]